MDDTQMTSDSILESVEEENKEENENKKRRPLAKLCILKNEHIPETELPLFLGDNVLGRDPNTCNLLLSATSISKQHATIRLSVYRRRGRRNDADMEALIWDLGSMNGTRKGHFKLTPNVRYALSEGDSLVVADIPCQYVSCTIDTVSSKGDMRTPVSRHSGVNVRMTDALGEKGGDTSTGSNTCVNASRVSLPGQEDTRKTPVRTSCLSFEQTPTQPQGTLVPESDSDSDEERGERRRKAPVSDSDSLKSGPTCSTFLSPTNKIVPESEDESPITPSSSTKNRPSRHVSFSKEEPDVDMGQQQLKNNSEEEGERAALEGRNSEESEQHVPGEQESNVSLTGDDEMPVFSPAVLTDAIPVFDMDSDTDMEGEEECVASAGPVTLNTNQQADQSPNTAQFHMDSDSDVDEDALHEVPKSVPSSPDHAPRVISVIQAEGITMDSDTDVDDDAVSDAAIKAKPTSLQSTHAADSSPSTRRNDLHLDSDTDIDEEEEEQCGTNNSRFEIDETPTRFDVKPTGPESVHAAPHSLNLDSDTDDEAIPAAAIGELSAVSAVTESVATADAGADLEVLSDSDTDEEDDPPLLIPVVVSALSVDPGTTSEALQSGSDADTDVDESSVPPAGDGVNPAYLGVDSDTDVEDKEVDFGETEGELEDMETQAFLIPSSCPFRRAIPTELSPCTDSLEDDLCVVAETQSFILQTTDCQSNPPEDHNKDPTQSSVDGKGKQCIRGGSFQLGLSDSSHLEGQARALAMESTQAFVSVVEGANLEDTQAYADRTSLEDDSNLQAYGEDEQPVRCPVMSEKEARVDLALEATQAYISEPNSCSEVETDEDERTNTATAETQPFHLPTSSTLAMAETQPMFALEEEEEEEEAAQSQERHLRDDLSVAETQLMHVSENEESDDEDLIPRKRRAKPQQLEEEQTQMFSLVETQPMHIGVAETQPMATSGNQESDVEDSIPGPRKRKAKQLWLEDEQTQTLTNSELSTVETQPMDTGEDGESDEEDLIPGPRKRRAKPLQLEEETQPVTISEDVSAVETQPMGAGERRKRRAKPIQEEDTQPLTNPVETKTVRQSQRGKGRETETGTSGTTIGGRRRTRARLREEEEQAECSEPSKRPTRGKMKALPTTRGRSGTSRPDEEEEAKQAQKESEEEEETLETERNNFIEEQEKRSQEQDGLERERKHIEEQERVQAENAERLRLEQQRAEKERIERERKEEDEKKRADWAQKEERLERERKEKEEQQRLEQEKAEREEKERIEKEREKVEKEGIERERKEEDEKKRADWAQKEERLERERKEKEEKERLEREKAEREEKERLEKERKKEEKLRLECEKAEREREQKERTGKERKEEEKERLKMAKREREEGLEREEQEKQSKEKTTKEQQEKKKKDNNPKTPTRAAPCTTEPHQDATILAIDDVPARRTRSRSNSSNSVSSERSASSVTTRGSRGRGRGRGATRTSGPPQAAIARSSNRRRTVAAQPTQQDSYDVSPQGVLSRSNSISSEISSCSLSSLSGGRGGRQRGRGRKTESDSILPINSQSGQNVAPTPTARGRKGGRAEESSNEVPHDHEKERTDSPQASATRGRQRANANGSKPSAGDKKSPSSQECAGEDSPLPKRNVRGRGQKVVKSETVETPAAPAVSDGEEAKGKRNGRKRELEANTDEDASLSSKISKGKVKAQTTEAAKGETKDQSQVQVKRKGRASSAQAKKNAKDSSAESEVIEESEKMEKGTVERRGRGRPSVVQKLTKEKQEESGASVDQEESEPQTPTGIVSRKRQALVDSSPVAKTRRSSSASPAAGGQLRAARQAYKVLFTGVVDEEGQRVLERLGGSMAQGVADMNCLVTDKVRRTVKFLCAVAKGVPIVNTHWLDESSKAGSFLSPNAFVVKDPEQEKKFNFCLQESLRIASSQPLLQGYEIHVTKSVKPEPVHMKDIISCSGATFLPKMPSSHKPQTVVISCEEDWPLCGPARSKSLSVVTAEFILTGILRQKLDLQTHKLSAPANTLQLAGGKGRSKKKT
ncbi:mediator of DNA damage checkpoint protein 1 isoform X2 [Cyclopterus lumpus]|uniref:mediator of DNA damage checkpoint protein 1 isoform X2 n=1 Tax=Cyclopterus lumpus TaxID=8103 RepID=UPI0014861DAF|nr:mediator of DNA damage checkpoint protein 1 isoform X2 [Cyclopterus lumpus]